jgi:hypothetical protein
MAAHDVTGRSRVKVPVIYPWDIYGYTVNINSFFPISRGWCSLYISDMREKGKSINTNLEQENHWHPHFEHKRCQWHLQKWHSCSFAIWLPLKGISIKNLHRHNIRRKNIQVIILYKFQTKMHYTGRVLKKHLFWMGNYSSNGFAYWYIMKSKIHNMQGWI